MILHDFPFEWCLEIHFQIQIACMFMWKLEINAISSNLFIVYFVWKLATQINGNSNFFKWHAVCHLRGEQQLFQLANNRQPFWKTFAFFLLTLFFIFFGHNWRITISFGLTFSVYLKCKTYSITNHCMEKEQTKQNFLKSTELFCFFYLFMLPTTNGGAFLNCFTFRG